MNEELLNFSGFLRVLMQEKRISAAALAAAMGLSSKTSVFRVLQDTASVEYQADFMARLIASDALALTEEETEQIKIALEISRIGKEQYLCYRAIEGLINVPKRLTKPVDVSEYCADGTRRSWKLQELVKSILENSDRVEMIILGWGHVEVMNELRIALLGQRPDQVRVKHYLCCNGRRFIEAVASIMPCMYLRGYEAYCLKDDTMPLELRSFLANSSGLITLQKDGVESYIHFHVLENGTCDIIRFTDKSVMQFHRGIVERGIPYFRSVKTVFDLQDDYSDYLRYIEFYLHMESGHPAYILRYDVPIMFIPTNIQTKSAVDGFMESGFYTREDVEDIVSRFIAIERLRWKAAFSCERPTHVVFSWKGMLKFVRSGKASDQFFGMRPYTPDERLAIMMELKRQMVENPHFNLYFTPADSDMIRDEISYYDGYGLFFCKGETDYNLDAEHAEALITQPDFCNSYRSYFTAKLLKTAVVPHQKALQMMDELISIARSQMC